MKSYAIVGRSLQSSVQQGAAQRLYPLVVLRRVDAEARTELPVRPADAALLRFFPDDAGVSLARCHVRLLVGAEFAQVQRVTRGAAPALRGVESIHDLLSLTGIAAC